MRIFRNIALLLFLLQGSILLAKDMGKPQIEVHFCESASMGSGFAYAYHPNGNIQIVMQFQDSIPCGVWLFFDEKGNLVKQLVATSELKSNYYFDFFVNDDTIYEYVDEEAKFSEGNIAVWVGKNFKFPASYAEITFQGKFFVEFVVEKDGSIEDCKIVRGFDEEMNDSIYRMMEKMPKWIPAKVSGKIVRSRIRVPINIHFY